MTGKAFSAHRSRRGPCGAALTVGVALGLAGFGTAANAKPTYTTIDPPGSTNTQPYCINAKGNVAGNYYDSNNVSHGFLRTVDGTITTFDPPGSTNTQVGDSGCINDQDVIVGYFAESNGVLFHGYIRAANGNITVIDVPKSSQTQLFALNDKGVEGGLYYGSNGYARGILRRVNGKFDRFDGAHRTIYTTISGVNESKAASGEYQDGNQNYHGLVRAADGTITDFDVAGSISTYVTDSHLTDDGALTGYYNSSDNAYHGFLRAGDGTITTFDAPNDPGGTYGMDINNSHVIAGYYVDSNKVLLGLVRDSDGAITTFRVPQAGKRAQTGTNSEGINDKGWIEGSYRDNALVIHGYLRTP